MRIRKTSQSMDPNGQILDTLESDSNVDALSAKQGKILKQLIDAGVKSDSIYIGTEPPTDSKYTVWINPEEDSLDRKEYDDVLPVGTVISYDGDDIPEGYEEIEDCEAYSTDETKTNKTWINGKPIYRKVIDIGSITKAQQKTGDTGIRNWDNIISQIGVAFNGTNYDSRPNFFVYKNGTTLRYSAYNSAENNTQCYLTVEYTKTTD